MKNPRFELTTALLILSVCHVSATIRYVNVNNASPASPYTSWSTAATGIQQAVDAATAGDEIVVTNGTYATGGRAAGTSILVNRLTVEKQLMLRSVNGPQFTLIQGRQVPGTTNGDGAIRCVYLSNGARLSGFTLTNGATRVGGFVDVAEAYGGGLLCNSASEVVSNCVVVANSAYFAGGGTYVGTLNNCILSNNSAGAGGGAAEATLNNCTLIGNSADSGGGIFNGKLNNCTL